MNKERLPVLIIKGTVGVGKSTVGLALHDLFSESAISHTFLDLDQLTYSRPQTERFNRLLMFEALGALWPVYKASGSMRLVLARVIVDEADLQAYEEALGPCSFTIIRLMAPELVRKPRLQQRESDDSIDWFLNRTVELDSILDNSSLQFVEVVNDNNEPHQVAREILNVTAWVGASLAV